MKRIFFLYSLVFYALMTFGFLSCENKDVINSENINDQQFVLATHTTGLFCGVDSVQVITSGHPLFKEFISFINSSSSTTALKASSTLKNGGTSEDNIGIYYYEDNKEALLVKDEPQNIVYVYIVDTDTKALVNVFAVTLIDSPVVPDDPNPMFGGFFDRWKNCMKDAMNRLYNDWDDDPLGTVSCLFTGELCIIGGGLGCAFLSLIEMAPQNILMIYSTLLLNSICHK